MGNIIKYQNSSFPLINRVNKSKANFVKRLLDPNRKSIQNWVNPLSISTHKLGWATEDTKQGAFVYPEVQEINGELIDFTHPSHRRSEGMNSAIERRDTVRMTPEQAKWFTENYKEHYPGFQDGGVLNTAGKIAGGFVPFYGTYLNWKDYKENPTLANLGWTIASGLGDIASLTGVGYGVVAGTKAIKAANTARKGVKAINTARKATRAANQIKMLEYGDVGKNAWKGWVASGKNLANSNKKLSEATKALQQAGVRFAIDGGIDTIDAGRTMIK